MTYRSVSEISFAYPGRQTRQNRRSRDYELVGGYKRREKTDVCTGFSACKWYEQDDSDVFHIIFVIVM